MLAVITNVLVHSERFWNHEVKTLIRTKKTLMRSGAAIMAKLFLTNQRSCVWWSEWCTSFTSRNYEVGKSWKS